MRKLLRNLLRRWLYPDAETVEPTRAEDVYRELQRVTAAVADLQHQWADTLDKIATWAKRQAARDRKRAAHALESIESAEVSGEVVEGLPAPDRPAQGTLDDKAELRRRFAAMRGGIR